MLKLPAMIIAVMAMFSASLAHAQDTAPVAAAVRKAQTAGTVLNVDVSTGQLTPNRSGKAFW